MMCYVVFLIRRGIRQSMFSGLFGLMVLPLISLTGWLGLIVKAAMITAVYLIACLAFGLSSAERTTLLAKLTKRT